MATSSGSWSGSAQIDEEMPEFLRIPPSDIKIGRQIGQGGFSTVHKATWLGKQCAAKVVRTADVLAIQKEVAILSKLSHPHIMGCTGFSVDSIGNPSRCMILMELMESDLRHLMDKRLKKKTRNALPFSETEAVDILCQIASGMEYLHGQGVFHGDLKASNVLLSHDCDGKIHVKITDFGVSQMVKLGPAETSEKFIRKKHFQGVVGTRGYQAPEVTSSSVIIDDSRRRVLGTRSYQAPEVSQYPKRKSKVYEQRSEEFYTAKADIYCFAMTCYEILSGRVPFESVRKPDIPALVLKGIRPELPHGLDRHLVALIDVGWDQKPSKRPRFSDIKRSLESWPRDQSSEESWSGDQSLQEWASENRNSQEMGSKDQSRKKAPKCWGRLWRRSRRGK